MLQAGEASAAPALAGAALDKLKQAHELIMRAGDSRQTRLAYQLGALMAREQLVAQDPASARRLLQSVAGTAVGQCAGALYMCFACCAHRHPILCVCGAQTALHFVWTLSYILSGLCCSGRIYSVTSKTLCALGLECSQCKAL